MADLGPGTGIDDSFAVGQRVWGIAHGSLGTAVASPTAMLVAVPPVGGVTGFSALPTAFATAQQALRSIAGVRSDDTVLVHAAAGAVGLATLQARSFAARALLSAMQHFVRRMQRCMAIERGNILKSAPAIPVTALFFRNLIECLQKLSTGP